MQQKIIYMSALLLASAGATAETSLLEAAGKQMARDAIQSTAPGAVKNVEAAKKAVDDVKATKRALEQAPAAIEYRTQQTKESVKKGVAAEAAANAAKRKAVHKATEKAFDQLFR